MITGGTTVRSVIEQLILAPLEHPELLPSLLPLIAGWIVIELYFGKHENERLGWNTSVGNAVIWVATGVNLLVMGGVDTAIERAVSYLLVLGGGFIGYMNFYHKWSPEVAYRISSADVIYPLAYVAVVVVKTDMQVNSTVLKSAGLFVAGSIAVFHLVRMFEAPARDQFMLR